MNSESQKPQCNSSNAAFDSTQNLSGISASQSQSSKSLTNKNK
jgi:hypothetical protein